jgi:hypothetical protein
VTRHQGRVIFLEYVGAGEIEKTLYLVGKVNKYLKTVDVLPGYGDKFIFIR